MDRTLGQDLDKGGPLFPNPLHDGPHGLVRVSGGPAGGKGGTGSLGQPAQVEFFFGVSIGCGGGGDTGDCCRGDLAAGHSVEAVI